MDLGANQDELYMRLVRAVIEGKTDDVAQLLTAGAKTAPRTGEQRFRLLHIAASIGLVEIARLLMDSGMDIDEEDENGRTPMYTAVFRGHDTVVKALLEKGATVSQQDVEIALSAGRAATTQMLLGELKQTAEPSSTREGLDTWASEKRKGPDTVVHPLACPPKPLSRLQRLEKLASEQSQGGDLCQTCRETMKAINDFRQDNLYYLGSISDIGKRKECTLCRMVFQGTKHAITERSMRHVHILSNSKEVFDIISCSYVSAPSDEKMPHPLLYIGDLWISEYDQKRVAANDCPFHLRCGKHDCTRTDLAMVRGWIDDCLQHHPECGSRFQVSRYEKPVTILLVDVVTKSLVKKTTDVPYVALSYVWGSTQMYCATRENLSLLCQEGYLDLIEGRLSKVLRDAMTVVAGLGERYLWTDTLCIVQDDKTEKHTQILQMDIIFSHALLTIIALSGDNADVPLPGVRSRSRDPRDTFGVIQGRLCAVRKKQPYLSREISTSLYSTRGWTFQESLLSRRRLYFGASHVFLHCSTAVYDESAVSKEDVIYRNQLSDLDPLQVCKQRLFEATLDPETRTPPLMRTTDSQSKLFLAHDTLIQHYTLRRLTVSSDIVLAYSGVAQLFSQAFNCDLVCGLPLPVFDQCLLWVPSGGQRRLRSSGSESNPTPSWSWTSWNGPVEHLVPVRKPLPFDEDLATWIPLVECIQYTGPCPLSPDEAALSDPRAETILSLRAQYNGSRNVKLLATRTYTSQTPRLEFRGWVVAATNSNAVIPRGSLCADSLALPLLDHQLQECGFLWPDDCSDLRSQWHGWPALDNMNLVLLSKSTRNIPAIHGYANYCGVDPNKSPVTEASRFRSNAPFLDTSWEKESQTSTHVVWSTFNIMVIEWKGESAERIAVGQIRPSVWKAAEPREMPICLI